MLDVLQFLSKELSPAPLASEVCSIVDAGKRVVASDIFSTVSVPHYDESTRDGYALGTAIDATAGNYKLIPKEAFAGNIEEITLSPGQACPIMTGGLVPLGAVRVIPKELAAETKGWILKVCDLSELPKFVRKSGSDVEEGQLIVKKGTQLQPDHLSLLAQAGYSEVEVYRRPRVALFATGSELIAAGNKPVPGQKVASNCYLLQQLCRSFGAEVHNFGIVNDDETTLKKFLQTFAEDKFDIIVSTGGMGPGKYDLLETCFAACDGRIVTNSLPLAPGKSTLVGWLKECLFFGLPGTPSAVRPLFSELIAPALLSLQGVAADFPIVGQAILQDPLNVKKSGTLTLCPGRLESQGITRVVKLPEKDELANCYILLFPERGSLNAGTVVMIHETRSPFEG